MKKKNISGSESQLIGEIGEKVFSLLCSNAGLVCNEATKDKTGWDFYVEFPLDENFKGTLDLRPPAIRAFFQVKTSSNKKTTVEVKLSNAERMVTEPNPTFFAIGMFDKASNQVSFSLGHLGKEVISFILRELRRFGGDKIGESNRKILRIPISLLEVDQVCSPSDITSIIKKYSHNSIEKYIRDKLETTRTVGLNSDSYRGSFSIRGEHADDRMVALMIGEIKELKVSDFEVTETRFDIAVTKAFSSSAIMSIKAENNREATILFKNNKLDLCAEYQANLRVPSILDIADDKFRVRLEADLFAFSIGPSVGISSWIFTPDCNRSKTWPEIKNDVKFVRLLMAGGCQIECFTRETRFAHGEMKTAKYSGSQVEIESLCAAIDAIDVLYKNISNRSKLKFSVNEFYKFISSNNLIFYVLARWRRDRLKITSVLERVPDKKPKEAKFVLPLVFQCGGQLTAVAVVIEGPVELNGKNIKLMPSNVFAGDCDSFDHVRQCVSFISRFAKDLSDNAADDDFIVVDEAIYPGDKVVDHLLSL